MGTWERAWGAGTHRLQRRVGGRVGREARQAVGGEAGQGPCGEACIALQSGAEQSRVFVIEAAGMLPADAWMIRPGCHAAPLVEEQEQQQERHQHCFDRVASVGGEERGEAGAGARVEAVWEIVGSRGDVGVGHRADWGVSI